MPAAFWIVTLSCSLWLGQGAPFPTVLPLSEGEPEVDLAWGLKVPMRDGVQLSATLYRPRGSKEKLPAIVTLTPYIADSYHERAMYFARQGFAFVLADSRGRGNSGGVFEPFVNEGKDGHDLVEWVAKQPWCNGKVGMWGGSYGGYNQWATLRELPLHLRTIVPVASAHPGVDVPAPGGIMSSYWMQWLTLTSGLTLNQKLFNDPSFWIAKYRQRFFEHRPFRNLDVVVGNPNKHFQKWVHHRRPDAYWDAMVLTPTDYARIDIPILTITGYYDADQPGAMEFYHRHMKYGTPAAKLHHFLVIGPWDHAGTRTPKEEVGGVTFGKASLIDMDRLHRDWYHWTLRDGPPPSSTLLRRVLYYVPPMDRWQYVDSLDAIGTRPRRLYLHSTGGQANDVFHSGTLSDQKPEPSAPDQFTYDPLDVRPAELEKEKNDQFLTDQRFALNLFGNGLVYHTAPFPCATEITGYLKFVAWIALNVPDTDFQVQVYEILPQGGSVLLAQDRLRARYRESLRQEKLVKPGEVNRYEFNGFWFFSRRISKGSRLRLVFSCPNSIYLEKNYNSGGAVENESKADARTARITLYHDSQRPSYLEIPEVKR